jgi:hypothetical protein
MNRQRTHVWIVNASHERSRGRELLEMLECPPHFLHKSVGYFTAPLTVPGGGFA